MNRHSKYNRSIFVNFRLEHAEMRLVVGQREGNCKVTDNFVLNVELFYCMGLRIGHSQYS